MNRNIIIGLMSLLSVASVVFGLYEKHRADLNETKFEEQKQVTRETELLVEDALRVLENERKIQKDLVIELQKAEEQNTK